MIKSKSPSRPSSYQKVKEKIIIYSFYWRILSELVVKKTVTMLVEKACLILL